MMAAKAKADEYLASDPLWPDPIEEIVAWAEAVTPSSTLRPSEVEAIWGLWKESERTGIWGYIRQKLLEEATLVHADYLKGNLPGDSARVIEGTLRLMANLGNVMEKRHNEVRLQAEEAARARQWADIAEQPFVRKDS